MSTDPRGRCFISYRRTRLDEIALLVKSLHDFGIPTWQDIENLPEEPTEWALRAAVADRAIAAALLWITPEVEHSPIIRQIEAPGFLERARNRNGFTLVPVCAGGVDYADAGIVVDPRFTLEDVPGWNLRSVVDTPAKKSRWPFGSKRPRRIDAAQAAAVACRVLRRRFESIAEYTPSSDPVVIRAASRTPPSRLPPADLVLDWRHRFEGRHAVAGAFDEHLLPAMKTIADVILEYAPDRKVVCEGQVPLPVATALGAAFLQPLGLRASWRQTMPGAESQEWSLFETPETVPLDVSHTDGRIDADELAVLVSVNGNVETGFAASRPGLPGFRAVTHVHGPGKQPFRIESPGQALHVATTVVNATRAARERLRTPGRVHLFLCGPTGLAFLIGQLSNQLQPVQTYEFDPEDHGGRYMASVLVRQVAASNSLGV